MLLWDFVVLAFVFGLIYSVSGAVKNHKAVKTRLLTSDDRKWSKLAAQWFEIAVIGAIVNAFHWLAFTALPFLFWEFMSWL